MKTGDLVTLSSYCLQRTDMWRWRDDLETEKPLVGLVVRLRETRGWKS